MTRQKKCPKCGYVTNDLQFVFCPCCDEEIRLVEVGTEQPNVSVATANTTTSACNEQSDVQILASGNVVTGGIDIEKKKAKETDTTISLGTGNAVSGGIHSSTTINDSSSSVVNVFTTQKTQAEVLIENRKLYRARCKELFYDGFITDEGLKELEDLRLSLDFDKDIAAAIREDVRNLSVKVRKELPLAGKIKVETAQVAIEQNNVQAINSIVPELEGWMNRVHSSELSQIFHQLSAITSPALYIKKLNENNSEDYWKTYWAYVAYNLQGLNAKAEASLAELTAWDSFYPQQNQVLLLVAGGLMNNDENAARLAYSKLSGGVSPELTLLKDTVSELLDRNYETNYTADVQTRVKFYAQNLFPRFLDSIETKKQKNNAKKLETAALEERNREKIRYQKETLLHEYEKNGGDVDAVCRRSGVALHTFQTWVNEDPVFANTYNSITAIYERKKADELAQQRKQMEQKAVKEQQKKAFAMLYKDNRCDVLKTCSEIGVSVADCRKWRAEDAAFNDEIAYIERQHKSEVRKESSTRRKQVWRKVLPYIIAVLLVVAGVFAVRSCNEKKAAAKEAEQVEREIKQKQEEKKKEQEKLQQENKEKEKVAFSYEDLRNEFVEKLNLVNNTSDGLDALSDAYNIVKKMRLLEKTEYFIGIEAFSIEFKETLDKKAKKLKDEADELKYKGYDTNNDILIRSGERIYNRIKKIQDEYNY